MTLRDAGKALATMEPQESLWQAGAGSHGVTSATFYNRLRKYMVAAGRPLPASTFSATRLPSCAAMRASRSSR